MIAGLDCRTDVGAIVKGSVPRLPATPGTKAGNLAAWVAVLSLLYAGLAHAVTVVSSFGGSQGTTFWPAAGVTVAALVFRPRRDWPWLLAGVWVAEFLLDYQVSHIPLSVSAGWATANCVEPTMAALLLTRRGRRAPNLANTEDLLRFLMFAVLAGPLVGSLVGVGTGALAGFYSIWPALPRWFVGDAVGALVIAPMALTILRGGVFARTSPRALAGLVCLLAVVAGLAVAPWNVTWALVLPFLLVPVLAFTALRLGPPGAATGLAVVAIVVNMMTAAGFGPFAQEDHIVGLIEAQAFLAMSAFTALVVAALTDDLFTREEAEELKSVFVNTIAHDIRGPLGVIGGFVELLRSGRLDPGETQQFLDRIDATAKRLLRLSEDILDVHRMGGRVVQPAPVDLDIRLRALIDSLAVGDHPVTLVSEPIRVEVDIVGVERIVENLVSNAVRHTPAGTPIRVSARMEPDGVLLMVDDEGPGVPDAEKEQIFEAFRRGNQTLSGTGVGLSLVARFAQAHGGRAWVQDRPGGGASFRVFLAARTAPHVAEG